MSMTTTDLARRIEELWDAERCSWKLEYDGGWSTNPNPWPWTLSLEWAQEYDNPHGADWTTYTWQVYAETPDIAMGEAVSWLEALATWADRTARESDGSE